MPALAGQRADYLEKVLRAYRKGERKSSQMAAMSGTLTAATLRALPPITPARRPAPSFTSPVPAK